MTLDSGSVPQTGQWPVDPQIDLTISEDRIWIDGCFDFAHHGHAGAMLQARRLGKELTVGVHSDEEILRNKGPTVMTLRERLFAVEACRWTTKSVPNAPYVTSLPWISHYGCYYVVHGDDVTSDGEGEDCYRYVKAAGRFCVVKRTAGISTTDLVGRMLLCTKTHFIRSLERLLHGIDGSGDASERQALGSAMQRKITEYASDETGLQPGCTVFSWIGESEDEANRAPAHVVSEKPCKLMVEGQPPHPGQRIVYVDGGFDLFSSGHIEFLRQVAIKEAEILGRSDSFDGSLLSNGLSYIIVGVHEDMVINHWKGLNYPIMNIFERGLCVLQCRYVNCVVFSAPFAPSMPYLSALPFGRPHAVYHGPTSFMPLNYDPYTDAKALGVYQEIGDHSFQHVNAEEVVQRILRSRQLYEARQKVKGAKALVEDDIQRQEGEESFHT